MTLAYSATVGFSSIESSNIVGYTSNAAHQDLNWYAPHFAGVGVNTIDINSIKLDDGLPAGEGTVGWGEPLQIVGPLGSAETIYLFYAQMMDSTGTVETPFFWGDEDGVPVDVKIPAGAGFAIDNPEGVEYKIKISCPYKK